MAEDPRRSQLAGRLGGGGVRGAVERLLVWGGREREGGRENDGDTYLINWPRSSHRVSQPGHLHSPCP